jgi:hypothetical protein
MPDTEFTAEPKALPAPRRRLSRTAVGAGACVALLVAGAALGAGGTKLAQRWQPRSVMLLQPAPINAMTDAKPAAIKGEVAELFGNKFIVQDGSGRALVDTGPGGERRAVAAKGETLTVQGRFDRGVLHADVVTHADGRNEAFGPPRPPHGPDDRRADRGPQPPHGGPDHDPDTDAPPPPQR